jgi:hypothetical protein
MAKRDRSVLKDVAARATALRVECVRCKSRTRIEMQVLLVAYGPDFPMTHLRAAVVDCPRRQAEKRHERCDVHFPDLNRMIYDENMGRRSTDKNKVAIN